MCVLLKKCRDVVRKQQQEKQELKEKLKICEEEKNSIQSLRTENVVSSVRFSEQF